jgi:hypothetical protein
MRLGPVRDPFRACHTSAASTAIEVAVCFYTVPDHLDPAVLTGGSKGMDGAFEAVEGVRIPSRHTDVEGFGVKYATHKWTHSHGRRSTIAQTSRPLSIAYFTASRVKMGMRAPTIANTRRMKGRRADSNR